MICAMNVPFIQWSDSIWVLLQFIALMQYCNTDELLCACCAPMMDQPKSRCFPLSEEKLTFMWK